MPQTTLLSPSLFLQTLMADPPISVKSILNDYPKAQVINPNNPLDFMLSDDPQFDRLKEYARNLPYPVESNAYMQELLEFILKRYLYFSSIQRVY